MNNKTKHTYIFFVQGEGRGHITQAMTLYNLLLTQGHVIQAVIVTVSKNRKVPDFFLNYLKVPVYTVQGPNFITDNNVKSINWLKTIAINIFKFPTHINQFKAIKSIVNQYKPEIIINFYDLLCGIYLRIHNKQKAIAIAHQYTYLHPSFKFPKGFIINRLLIKLYTKLTAGNSIKKLAISFYEIKNNQPNLIVIPPVIRKEVLELKSEFKDIILIYLVNPGYFDEIVKWHINNPSVHLHCFTDSKTYLSNNFKFNTNTLKLHDLCNESFLKYMSISKAVATTAGFESVCEAMYLGKPLLMVPVKRHFEQFCNSRDANSIGAGLYSDHFDLNLLIDFSTNFNPSNLTFKNWVNAGYDIIQKELLFP